VCRRQPPALLCCPTSPRVHCLDQLRRAVHPCPRSCSCVVDRLWSGVSTRPLVPRYVSVGRALPCVTMTCVCDLSCVSKPVTLPCVSVGRALPSYLRVVHCDV
jgi:hypothetical protein